MNAQLIISKVAELAEVTGHTMSDIIGKLTGTLWNEEEALELNDQIIDDFEPEWCECAIESPGYYAFFDTGVEEEEIVVHTGDRDGNWETDGTGIPATIENMMKFYDTLSNEADEEWKAYAEEVVATGNDPQGHFTGPIETSHQSQIILTLTTETFEFVSLKVRLKGEDFEFTDKDDERIPKGLYDYCMLDDGPEVWQEIIDDSGVTYLVENDRYLITAEATWKEPRPESEIDSDTRANAEKFLLDKF